MAATSRIQYSISNTPDILNHGNMIQSCIYASDRGETTEKGVREIKVKTLFQNLTKSFFESWIRFGHAKTAIDLIERIQFSYIFSRFFIGFFRHQLRNCIYYLLQYLTMSRHFLDSHLLSKCIISLFLLFSLLFLFFSFVDLIQ